MVTTCDHHNKSEGGPCERKAQVHCNVYHIDLYLITYIFCLEHWPEHEKSIRERGNWPEFFIEE